MYGECRKSVYLPAAACQPVLALSLRLGSQSLLLGYRKCLRELGDEQATKVGIAQVEEGDDLHGGGDVGVLELRLRDSVYGLAHEPCHVGLLNAFDYGVLVFCGNHTQLFYQSFVLLY